MSSNESPFEVGKSYFMRTVTYHLVGRITKIIGDWLVLDDAAWIADSGRFANAIASGDLVEVEPVGIAFLNVTSITDAFPWVHNLPLSQK